MELTKEIIERIYSLIEKSKTDGKIRKGVNEVTKSLERGEAKLSVSAEDISPAEITAHLPTLAKEKGIVHVTVPSKTELGAAAGLPVATASVAVVSGDSKLIDALLKDIKIITEGKAKPKSEEKTEEAPAEEKTEEAPAEEKTEEAPAEEKTE
jgi:large subunit ribosomal protein L7Ae